MKDLLLFQDVCKAMAEPSFYPHPVEQVEIRETHISFVFLAGDWVYKLKKPVSFGFLNFHTLHDRHHFCLREVLLNQRLTRNVYDKVVGICRDKRGRYRLDSGQALEFAVKMRRLPAEACLVELLKRRSVTDDELSQLGRHLSEFYSRSENNPEIDHYGDPEVIAFNMEENFQQVEPFVDGLLDRERWEFIREVSRAFFHDWSRLFENRITNGCIRDGHGDLRAEHVYFYGGIQIIDCIEFNDRFRYGDVVADLAFLHMDLESLDQANASKAIMSAYSEHSGDHQCYSLLDFYSAYRAIVKVKVTCLRSTEVDDPETQSSLQLNAGYYLEQAYRYALQFSRPTLWVFCGLPATGKSALADKLSQTLSMAILKSDRIRKEGRDRFALKEEILPFGQGIYRSAMRQRVYARMLALAQELLKKGQSVILDATFSRTKWREEAMQLATDLDSNVVFLECVCSLKTIKGRLEQREQEQSISDARLSHLHEMVESFEALREIPVEMLVRLDTELPLGRCLLELLAAGYASKCTQVKQVLAGALA